MEQVLKLLEEARRVVAENPTDPNLPAKLAEIASRAPEEYRWVFDEMQEPALIQNA